MFSNDRITAKLARCGDRGNADSVTCPAFSRRNVVELTLRNHTKEPWGVNLPQMDSLRVFELCPGPMRLFTNPEPDRIVAVAPNLEVLRLNHTIVSREAAERISAMEALTELDISEAATPFGTFGQELESADIQEGIVSFPKHLTSLDVSRTISSAGLKHNLLTLRSLRYLNLGESNLILNDSFGRAVLETLTELVVLNLGWSDLCGGLKHVVRLPRLRSLSLDMCSKTYPFYELNDATGLRELSMESLHMGRADMQWCTQPRRPKGLLKLNLRYNQIDYKCVMCILTFRRLTSLDLSNNWLTDEAAFDIRLHLPRLRELDVSSNEIGDEGVAHLAEWWKLAHLDVSGNAASNEAVERARATTRIRSIII